MCCGTIFEIKSVCNHNLPQSHYTVLPHSNTNHTGACYSDSEFGSKTLINKLRVMGHCVSYYEVRHFLTSVTADQMSKAESSVYIHSGLSGVSQHEKAHNSCYATVVYRKNHVSTAEKRIGRISQSFLVALNTYDFCLYLIECFFLFFYNNDIFSQSHVIVMSNCKQFFFC